jgi:hypothetical protein
MKDIDLKQLTAITVSSSNTAGGPARQSILAQRKNSAFV